jgi:hypothetical protein
MKSIYGPDNASMRSDAELGSVGWAMGPDARSGARSPA